MRIAFIYTSPFPAKRGYSAADRRVRDLVRGLIYAKASVSLLIPKYHINKSDIDVEKEFNTEYLGTSKKFKLLNRLIYWFKVLGYVKKNEINAVFLYNTQLDSVFFAWFLSKRKIKIITEICDLHSNSDFFTLKSFFARLTEKYLPRYSNMVITISKYLTNHIRKYDLNVPIFTIPILVDTDFFSKKIEYSNDVKFINNSEFLISYVGGLWKHQGVRYLMEAFKLIIDDNYNAKLLIAGDYEPNDNKDDVISLSKMLAIEEQLILPGWVKTNSVKEILDNSDLLVISQTNQDFTQAGLPTKLAEYCAVNKPILITKVGDVMIYFKDKVNCIMCEPDNVYSIYEGIKYAIDNKDKLNQIADNAHDLALSVFDYKVNGKKLLIKINEL